MLGQAHERLGRVHDALQAYRKVADEPLGRSAPREFFRVQERAQAMVEEITPRVPSLLIGVQGLPPMAVKISLDGAPVSLTSYTEPVLLNPGRYKVTVEAPGKAPATQTVALAEGERRELTFELNAAKCSGDWEPAGPERAADPSLDDEDEKPGTPTAAIGSLIVGGIGLGVGVATGLIAQAKADDLRAHCPPPSCAGKSPELVANAMDVHDQAETMATISTVSFVVGGVATAASVALLATSPSGKRFWKRNFGLVIGPGYAGVQGVY